MPWRMSSWKTVQPRETPSTISLVSPDAALSVVAVMVMMMMTMMMMMMVKVKVMIRHD